MVLAGIVLTFGPYYTNVVVVNLSALPYQATMTVLFTISGKNVFPCGNESVEIEAFPGLLT